MNRKVVKKRSFVTIFCTMKDTSYKQVLLVKFNKSKNIGIKSFFFSPV